MPEGNRRDWSIRRAKLDFRQNKHETDANKIHFFLQLGETQLETIQHHLKTLEFIETPPRSMEELRGEQQQQQQQKKEQKQQLQQQQKKEGQKQQQTEREISDIYDLDLY